MKQYGNTMVVGIDHGYGNIKTARTVTPTGLVAYATPPVFDSNVLHIDGMYYRIGEGHKPFMADKTADQDFYLLTLAAIAKEMELAGISIANVQIAAGLPLTWVKTQRETFRRYLLQNESVSFEYNGTNYKVNITGCSVFPQGYTAVMDQLSEMDGVNMVADIGNGTMNIMQIVNRKPVESKCHTEKIGAEQCMIACRNAVMDEYGVKVDDAIITEIMMNGSASIGEKYLACIVKKCREYYGEIIYALHRYEYNPDLMRLYVVGGGSCIFKNFGNPENTTIVDDICATAKGYENLAHALLSKNG